METSLEEEKEQLDLESAFIKFIRSFTDRSGKNKYWRLVKDMIASGSISLYVDFTDLYYYDTVLANTLRRRPDEALRAFNSALTNAVRQIDPDYAEDKGEFFVRIRGLPESLPIRGLRSEYLNKLIMIDGILVRATPVKEKMVKALFKHYHPECGAEFYWPEEGEIKDTVEPPPLCPVCQRPGNIRLIPEKSLYIDWQRVVIQEKPEEIPPGQIPRSISVTLTRDLVDLARPGDRVYVVGVLRVAQPSRKTKPVYDMVLEANSIEVSQKTLEEVEITREDEERIIELSRDPWIRKKIIASIAPAIYGHWDIKEAIALSLFGGVPKETKDGMRIRGDIHVLLVGDPGTAKSQLLQYVSRIAPRAIYTTGKGSSAAGLTAAVVKEKSTGEFFLEAGALVLADGGVALIDEIDKMRDEDRVAIHEAMEQQSFHPNTLIEIPGLGMVPIGEYVESLFSKYPHDIEKVGDTVYLKKLPENLKLFTTDFSKTYTVKPSVLSKHRAPKNFVRIVFSNGYQVTVTPEHPVFILSDKGIETIRAEQIKEGMFVPAAPGTKGSVDPPWKKLYSIYTKLLSDIKCPRPLTASKEEIIMLVDSCRENMPQKMLEKSKRILDDIEKIAGMSWHKITIVEKVENKDVEWVYDITVNPTRRFVSGGVVLHNTVSIAKAGIVARLNARASVIAAGNPKYGRYIEDRLLADNINLPVTILSRFDLIFILKDKPEPLYDASLATHVLRVHKETEEVEPEIPIDLLKKYISYARRYVKPRLTDVAEDMLKNFFVEMRRMGAESPEGVVTITARQLEALVRLAEAHARMALKNEVTEEDAAEAIRLMRVFLEHVGMETETGAIDIDAIMVGKPKSRREKMMIIDDSIKEIIGELGEDCAPLKMIIERVKREGVSVGELEDLLRRMHKEGLIFERRPGCYSRVT